MLKCFEDENYNIILSASCLAEDAEFSICIGMFVGKPKMRLYLKSIWLTLNK